MRIHHSYIAARLRASGKCKILAQSWAMAAGDSGDLSAKADELLDAPDSAKEFSHVLFVRDNEVVRSLELPDPAEAEKAARQADLSAARERLAHSTQAAQVAEQSAEAAQAALEARKRDEATVAALEGSPHSTPKKDADAAQAVLSTATGVAATPVAPIS